MNASTHHLCARMFIQGRHEILKKIIIWDLQTAVLKQEPFTFGGTHQPVSHAGPPHILLIYYVSAQRTLGASLGIVVKRGLVCTAILHHHNLNLDATLPYQRLCQLAKTLHLKRTILIIDWHQYRQTSYHGIREDKESPKDSSGFYSLTFITFPLFLRREGDSNPRNAFDVYTLSRRASSATRAPLLAISTAKILKNRETTLSSSKNFREQSFYILFRLFLHLQKCEATLLCQTPCGKRHKSTLVAFAPLRHRCQIGTIRL